MFRVSFVYHFTEKCDHIIPHNRTVMYNFHSNCFDEIVNNRDFLKIINRINKVFFDVPGTGWFLLQVNNFQTLFFYGFYQRIGTEILH